jgi:hypothetical protein
MKRKIFILISGAILLSLNGCIEDLLMIKGNGIAATEFRRTQAFTKIQNSTSIDLIYRTADTNGITIKADENLLEYIVTETFNNTLEIKFSEGNTHLDFKEKPVITVNSSRLESASLSGSGAFIANEMSGDAIIIKISGSGDNSVLKVTGTSVTVMLSGSGKLNLSDCSAASSDVFLSGSGNINLTGKSDDFDVKLTGSGEVFALDFQSESASVIISGSGNCYINAGNTLTGIISGSGNIYLKGNPVITQTISGSGRIIKYK